MLAGKTTTEAGTTSTESNLKLKAIDDGRHSSFIYFLLSAVHIIIIVVKICRYNQLGRVGYAVIKTN